ncbi:MAG: hypothetical protein WA824_09345, partial [Candidatus Sulfotelmatobacter sp.]
MRTHFVLVVACILIGGSAKLTHAQNSGAAAEKPLVSTGITGSTSASGLDDPQYVLAFVPVQRLMLEASRHLLSKAEIDKAIQGTPVTLERLLKLELVRSEDDNYRLNYLLLTKADQQTMYRVCAGYAQSLAEAFRSRKAEFDQIFGQYSNASLRQQLMFDLIAGAALNWAGLEVTTELGYRVQPPRHANGDIYIVHSAELGAQLDFTGLYLDSETEPGSKMSFSTFGDGVSLPRLEGLPDVFDGVENALEDWKNSPGVYAALRSEYISLILAAIDDAGQVMDAVSKGTDTDAALAKTLSVPERRKAIVQLLLAVGYLRETENRYTVGVPVLTQRDKPLVDATLKLSRTIMTDWLRDNYPPMKEELSGLSPMRNGVPFSLVFSEVWHYEFGFATKFLAESGFYANPRALGNRYEGYVPLVWENSLLKG